MKNIAPTVFVLTLLLTVSFVAAQEVEVAKSAAENIEGPLEGAGGAIRPEHDDLYDHLSRKFQCQCGCNASIKLCPHSNCHFAVPFRVELRGLIDKGLSAPDIIEHFVGKYGEVILRAPTKTGFNLVGYFLPYVALLLVGVALYKLLSAWTARRALSTPSQEGTGTDAADRDKYASRLEQELSEFEDE